MKLTPQERSARREAFRRMNAAQKVDYIFSYYKLPIVLTIVFIAVLCQGLYRHFSRKDVVLYLAYVNVSVSDDTAETLSDGFVRFSGLNTKKSEVYTYQSLYLSDDPSLANHEYAYASRLKILAAVNAAKMDVVLMNREAYDLLSGSGYLMELPDVLSQTSPELYQQIQNSLSQNRVILEDNSLELALGEAENYHVEEIYETNALDITRFPVFEGTDFTDSVYLGIFPNSPRMTAAVQYIAYLKNT